VLDNEENVDMHDWKKVVHKRVRKRRTSSALDDGRSDGDDGPRRATPSKKG
jgi:hypothetical protein